jgi:hypothetical protein
VRVNHLPACSLFALLLACTAAAAPPAVCRRPSPLQAPVDSWSTRFIAASPACLLACLFEHCLPARLRHCLALLDRTCRARESTLTTAFRPALPRPSSQSLSQSVARRPTCLPRPTDPPTRQRLQHHLARVISSLAQALISPTCRLLAACDLLDLAASATVSAPSPCDAAANNNATASLQLFACGRPIHLATSSPNKRADFRSFLA